MNIKLLNCPFCGGEATIDIDEDIFGEKIYFIRCTKCGLMFNDGRRSYLYDIQKGMKRWNTRTENEE